MKDPLAVIERLVEATNGHDLDALVACFADEYVNETPVHPDRGFCGNAQVRQNWEQIFRFVPNVHAVVLRSAVDGDVVWSEWEMRGNRPDGSQHLMRGVIIFGVDAGVIVWARFYLEPSEEGGGSADEFLRGQVGAP
jgi:ketosteroid isomerase-like protein